MDVLVAATFGIPGGVGLIAGFYGWRAGAASAVAGTLALSAGVYVYGALPATDCGDCTRYALFLPVAWVFVLMISGGWIVAIGSAAAGWVAGRWARNTGGHLV